MASKEKIKRRLKSARPQPVKEGKREVEVLTVSEGPNVDNTEAETPHTSKSRKSKDEDISELAKEKGAQEEELSKEGGKSLAAPKPKERRSASPFRRNVVEPVGTSGNTSAMGSAASLRSTTSSTREAWTDPNESSTSLQKRRKGSDASAKSSSTIVSRMGRSDEDRRDRGRGEDSRSDGTVAVSGPEQNAYIPYLYARNTILKITEDMKKMKTNHIRIVYDIERNYKDIEDETQTEFNGFVLRLREQYSGKVTTFRQVIEAYRTELQRKEDYWSNMVASLTERNNTLLKEKNDLLVQNKQEIERLENEKSEMTTQLTAAADHARSDAHASSKDQETTILQLKSEKEAALEEVAELKAKLAAALVTMPTLMVQKRHGKEREEKQEASLVRAVPLSQEEKDQLQREKDRMEDEKQGMTEERKQISDDRTRLGEDRRTWLDEVNKLQAEVTLWKTTSAEWEEKYRASHKRVEDLASLQDRFHQLESQYAALTAVVVASEDCKKAAQDNMVATKEEKDMMDSEKKRLEKDIKKFEADFEKRNGKKPTADDMSDSEREFYVQLEEVSTMVAGLERKAATLEAVQAGTVPPPPELPAAALAPSEPQVVTVEVQVPDPAIVVALERSQAERDEMLDRISQLQQQVSELHHQLGESNAELLDKASVIAELQAEVDSLKTGTVAVAATTAVAQGVDEEKIAELKSQIEEKDKELEGLRAGNREMHKDIKKMVKRHAKVQSKVKDAEADKQARLLLETAARIVHEIHGQVPEAAEMVEDRLHAAQSEQGKFTEMREKARRADHDWVKKYKKGHGGQEPSEKDRDSVGAALLQASQESARALEEQETKVQALTVLHTGSVVIRPKSAKRPSSAVAAAQTPAADLESQVAALDDKVIDLESENEGLRENKARLQTKVEELEEQVARLETQLSTQTVSVQQAEAGSEEVAELQQQLEEAREGLEAEKEGHAATKEELEVVEAKLSQLQQQLANEQAELDIKIDRFRSLLEAKVKAREEELEDVKNRKDELEAERLANVPLDTAKEIKNLQNKIGLLEKERSSHTTSTADLESKVKELQTKLDLSANNLTSAQNQVKDLEGKVKVARQDKDAALKRVRELESSRGAKGGVAAVGVKVTAGGDKALKDQVTTLKRENNDLNTRIKQLEREAGQGAAADTGAADKQQAKRQEKILKELEKRLDMEKAKADKLAEALKAKEEELKATLKDGSGKEAELTKLQAELATLGVAAKEGIEAAAKVKALEGEAKKLAEENKVLNENFNSERVLRKKYYNMVEDMKGKIRVYCRSRPLSTSEKERGNYAVVKSPDEYTVVVGTQRGPKEFQFDQIFMDDCTQEKVYEDTHNLIQSAVDGYNVCIFAYGQTGSGKTFTMIGDRDQRFPGIAPRAFKDIFDLAEQNRSKFKMSVSCYMLELYNEKLIDLFARPGHADEEKLDIKKDKKGLVVVQGAMVKQATNSKELNALFDEGSKNRHTASTKMNAESSRSHLVIGIVLESTSLTTGQVMKGKLSLVDLAGSERVAKTGASAEQLKEAMSINKSLSALGDVISALSSEQSFIPYRNNKLTMLMQDSLGGNAKTLMFVNISPADYNTDETVVSLTYASRVKLITNDASKNADNKEIARLKAIIQKLKEGEAVEEEV